MGGSLAFGSKPALGSRGTGRNGHGEKHQEGNVDQTQLFMDSGVHAAGIPRLGNQKTGWCLE